MCLRNIGHVISVEQCGDRVTRIDPVSRVYAIYSLVSGTVIRSRDTMKIKRGY